MPFGLTKKQISRIRQVLTTYPKIKEAQLFGSRAKGTLREGSDIDIALLGKDITHKDFLSLKADLNELGFVYTFDIVIYSAIKEKALKDHIDRVGVTFYQRDSTFEVEK